MGNVVRPRTWRRRHTSGRRLLSLPPAPRRPRRRRTGLGAAWLAVVLIALGAATYHGLVHFGIDPVPPTVRDKMVALRDIVLHGAPERSRDDFEITIHGPTPTPDTRPAAVTFALCRGYVRDNCVVDGDTIWYRGDKIRLADIDTPEVSEPRCAAEAARGRQATQRLLTLINSGPVTIVPAGSRDTDRYGRKLRIVEVGGRSLGDTLVSEGLARRWGGAWRSWCA